MTNKDYKQWCYETAHRQGKEISCLISTILIVSVVFFPDIVYAIVVLSVNNLLYWFGQHAVQAALEEVLIVGVSLILTVERKDYTWHYDLRICIWACRVAMPWPW